jgi:hypothetical protein
MPAAGFPDGETPISLHTGSFFDTSVEVQIPWTFNFYGVPYTKMHVHAAGAVTFGDPPPVLGDTPKPVAIPNPAVPNNMIAAWRWRLLCNSSPHLGIVRTQVVGSAPNRKLVVDWPNCRAWSVTSTSFKFQIWISENSDDIEIHYGENAGSDSPGTTKVWSAVGLENGDGTDGTAFCDFKPDGLCETSDFPEATALIFSPGPQVRVIDLEGPEEGFAGIAFPLRYKLSNPGSKPAENFTVQYWVSPEPRLGSQAISMGYAGRNWTLDPRQTVEVFAEPRLPIELDEGEYYVIVEADPHHVVDISNRAGTLGVFGPFTIGIRAPNIKVGWVAAPSLARPGEAVGIQWYVENTGNMDAVMIPYRVMLSRDGAWSPSLPIVAEGVIPSLASETFTHVDTEFMVPFDLEPGVHRVVVEANPQRDIFEHELRDNVGLSADFLVSDQDLVVLTEQLPTAHVQGHYEVLLRAAGGDGNFSWRLGAGSALPPGLQLLERVSKNGSEMATFLSGVPSSTGEYAFTLVVDSGGVQVEKDYVLDVEIAAQDLTVVTEHLADGTFGFPYDDELVAIGGLPPYSWEVVKGDLPLGVYLHSDGVLSGRPEKDGTFHVTVRVRDSDGRQGIKDLDLFVAPPSGLTCVTRRLEPLAFGEHVQVAVHAAGGERGPNGYLWSSKGTTWLATEIGEKTEFRQGPPPGLQIDGEGVINGTPQAFGSFVWTLNVKDLAGGEGIDCPVRLDVPRDRGLTVVTQRLPTAVAGRSYRTQLEATGGDGTLEWAEYGGGRILEDLELHFDATGNLVGTPPLSLLQGESEREFAITVRVTDQANRIGVGVVTLTLKAPGKKAAAAKEEESGCQTGGGEATLWALTLVVLGLAARRRHG